MNQPWFGLVFCNPPYGARRGHVPWLQKLIAHNNGVGLFRAYTSADWFHDVLLPARAVLMFPRGKIKFIRPSGEVGGSPGHGNVFIALGDVACEALLAIDPRSRRVLGPARRSTERHLGSRPTTQTICSKTQLK